MMAEVSILIVEDEYIIADDIKNTLEILGYHVAGIASTGEQAIVEVEKTPPDLLLMDIKLQGDMDGISAAAHIQSRFDIPVIYLTAYADDELLQRAKVTEIFGYLIKPFRERELHTTIEMALFKHKNQQELKKRLREVTGLNSILQKHLAERMPMIEATRDLVIQLRRITEDINSLSDRATSELLPGIQGITEPDGDIGNSNSHG